MVAKTTLTSKILAGLSVLGIAGIAGLLMAQAGLSSSRVKNVAIDSDANGSFALLMETQARLVTDAQAANRILAGPTTGSAAVPTMRALVDADIPDVLTVNNGTINLTPIGSTTASTGRFTTLEATQVLDVSAATLRNNTLPGMKNVAMRFEGATIDNNETFIMVEDPTADVDVWLRNTSGTIVVAAESPLEIDGDTGTISLSGSFVQTDEENTFQEDQFFSEDVTVDSVFTANGAVHLGDAGQPIALSGEIANAGGRAIAFEGATADENELSLTVVDPTADRSIALPNASGTVAVSASSPLALNSTTGNLTVTGLSGTNTGDVSLTSSADELLGLSGQSLSLDAHPANRVLATATSGGSASPTMRALVAADIPWSSPGAIGSGTPAAVTGTTVTATTARWTDALPMPGGGGALIESSSIGMYVALNNTGDRAVLPIVVPGGATIKRVRCAVRGDVGSEVELVLEKRGWDSQTESVVMSGGVAHAGAGVETITLDPTDEVMSEGTIYYLYVECTDPSSPPQVLSIGYELGPRGL